MNLLNKWNAEKIPMAKHHVDLTQLIVINAEASVLCVMGFVDKKNDKNIKKKHLKTHRKVIFP